MIPLFLSDFRGYIRNSFFNPDENKFPVFYFESETQIWFYKIFGNFMFYVELDKSILPEGITIQELKQEFKALELPKLINPSKKSKLIIED